jgi:hypothetical protein
MAQRKGVGITTSCARAASGHASRCAADERDEVAPFHSLMPFVLRIERIAHQ